MINRLIICKFVNFAGELVSVCTVAQDTMNYVNMIVLTNWGVYLVVFQTAK